MKAATQEVIPAIGTAACGGFFTGAFRLDDGTTYGLITAPKAEGEHKPTIWIKDYKAVPGAVSWNDGAANTLAMAMAGSKLAQWALELRIGGHNDWYIPSQDEAELQYRAFKPTDDQNSQWARSGINLSAIEPTRPYSLESPAQTPLAAFQTGGNEAFAADAYWTSTQHAAGSDCAWSQYFSDGSQHYYGTYDERRARAVRRVSIHLISQFINSGESNAR